MEKNILKGSWKQINGLLKQFWSKLTGNTLGELEGNIDEIEGISQKKYGLEKEKIKSKTRKKFKKLKTKIN